MQHLVSEHHSVTGVGFGDEHHGYQWFKYEPMDEILACANDVNNGGLPLSTSSRAPLNYSLYLTPPLLCPIQEDQPGGGHYSTDSRWQRISLGRSTCSPRLLPCYRSPAPLGISPRCIKSVSLLERVWYSRRNLGM